ncbi:MAG: hypothetical protein QOK37_4537 [Thermoanaerobaculia bacterium]|jgi:hypothetical protein|nr:hypothetical protein [Thermoanaerobaculia bacterium]
MRRSSLAAVVFFFAASCANIVHHDLTLTFDERGTRVTVAVATSIPTAKDSRDHTRDEHLREDILAGRDDWSLRFANASPEADRVTFERAHGELIRAEHLARIDVADLQKLFFDVAVSAVVTRGDGWAELAIYPGTSTRATRQQRDDAEKKLRAYSRRAVRYFDSVRVMYDYLNANPGRAKAMFITLFRDADDPQPPLVSDDEHDLVEAVRKSVDGLTKDVDREALEAEADAVFNPLPARIVVRIPGEPLIIEGFTPNNEKELIAEPLSLLQAIASLEGKWISPDPLAFSIRPGGGGDPDSEAAIIAAMPRQTASVVGEIEVADALVQKMRPAGRYRVRWITKSGV